MSELSGKVALITGATRGIGLAIATELSEAGARIAVVARDAQKAREVAAALPGEGHAGYGCDVGDASQARDTVASAEAEVGVVDVLVNNAGITRDNLLMRMKDEEFDEVIATNLKGAFNFTRAVSKGMLKRRDGVILNMTSIVGLTGNAGQANYAASKAGMIGLTKSVAKELAARGIRCNAIAPGFIRTDMTDKLSDQQVQKLLEQIPAGRLGEVADVAALVRFLAGPGARYITGQVLAVDGGMVM
jgi:3-oxoacyl-[acyl-carrier protein] reductase